jgi:CRP-like cAMP-binding protein
MGDSMEVHMNDLTSHPFFKGVPEAIAKELLGHAQLKNFERGEYLLTEGEKAISFYLIVSGRVSIQIAHPHRGSISLQTIEDGEVLGWSWMVEPYLWQFNALAAKHTIAIAFNAQLLRESCEKNFELGYQIMKRISIVFAERLKRTRMQLLDIYANHT